MFLNNYSIRVPEGKEKNSGYVVMEHNSKYHIVLKNGNATRCDARLEIDGKHQGTWRMQVLESLILERPAQDDGNFTFYKANSSQGNKIGLDSQDSNLGLIKVTFTPEKALREEPVYRTVEKGLSYKSYGNTKSFEDGSRGMSAGGTVSGHSNQTFDNAREMDLDLSKQTTIHLRLVSDDEADEPRPLTVYSNPVPPSICS